MKRSDAVKAVEALLQGNYPLADAIVTALEKRGMQPPTIKASFPLTKSDGTVQKSFTMVARWEPETEQVTGAWGSIADATGTSTDDI